ncbi:MAG TPA: N-acetylmuramoyl-L-alanine amidase [Chthoniobacterales bacterium]
MSQRYPKAKQDVSGRMKTRGRYAGGFPRGAIVHFTAGGPNAVGTVEGGIGNGYCFFVIAPNGDVYQNFNLDEWGYHAGKSAYPRLGSGVSQFLVGVEICNAGKLRQLNENTFRPWFNDPEYYRKSREPVPRGVPNPARDYPRDLVRFVERKNNCEAGWYLRYTKEQEKALEELFLWLKREEPDIFQFDFVLGHDEVSPGRKNDPGGALSMTMPEFRARLKALHAGKEDFVVPGGEDGTDHGPGMGDKPEEAENDSSEQKDPDSMIPAREATHFGRILPNCLFRTVDGDFFLSSSKPGESGDPRQKPFASAREREGQFAVIQGNAVEDVIRVSLLVEGVPPIASALLSKLLEPERGIREQVLGIAREVRDELIGDEPPPPASDPLHIVRSGPRPLCVIDIGHQPSAPGAVGMLDGESVSEFVFNTDLAKRIEALVKNAEIIIIHRPDSPEGYQRLPSETNRLNPAFVVSLHANGNGSTTSGARVLYYDTSKEGKKLANLLQARFLEALGLSDLKIKGRTSSERSGSQLFNTRAPIVIGEPFFITNPNDLRIATDRKDALAAAYAGAIDEYAAMLSQPPETTTSGRIVESHTEPGATFNLITEGLGKEKFLSTNEAALLGIIQAVNAMLKAKYGASFLPLTKEDAWVLLYCEAGLKGNGLVDPDHRHSEGERGLLPLPENVRFWNGPDAPVWNKPMPLARNVEHFFLYLGNLKNKEVTAVGLRHLYGDLFRTEGIAGDGARDARLLAGVVHGYFYSATYRNRSVPFDHLLNGFKSDTPLSALMAGTRYIHAGTSIIRGREKNVDTALGLV